MECLNLSFPTLTSALAVSRRPNFFYRANGVEQMGFFYADGSVSCVQVFTDAGENLHKLREPVLLKKPV